MILSTNCNDDISLRLVTKYELDKALSIQQELLPKYDASIDFESAAVSHAFDRYVDVSYYILGYDNNDIGLMGIYGYVGDRDNAWLDWFGILPEYRRKGFGTAALRIFENKAVALRYRYARILTDKFNNDAVLSFYASNGYMAEDYVNKFEDPFSVAYPQMIFSKSLTGEEVPLWDSRNIYFTEQLEQRLNI